jgi:fibronectin-binding autotransporter adhesin
LTSATEPASLAFVTQLCSNLFGVAPGAGALLNVGLPVWQVLQNLAQSSEFIADTSAAIVGFQSALLDGATPTGSMFQFGGTTATYGLTTGNDTNASLGRSPFTANDLITGIINQTGVGPLLNASTLNPGDALVLGGGTLSITDLKHLAGNELAGVSLTGPFKFVVNEIAPTAGTFDFLTPSGATNVESLNSSQNVSFTNLVAGTNVEIGGEGTVSGTVVQTSYAAAPAAVSYQIDGGVNGVTFEPSATSTNAPTSETILSTGEANGTAAHWDTFQATSSLGSVTQLTINATTGLVAELWNADFNVAAGATSLTVLGAAALVDLTVGGTDAPFSIVDASGLTDGGLHIDASGDLTSFTGGGGVSGSNELLWDGSALPAGATAIDGGGGTGNILSAQLVTSSNGNIFSNWQILDVTGLGGTAFDAAALVPTDPIAGVQFHSADLSAETVTNIAPAATVSVTGTGFTDAGLTLTHSSGMGNSLAVMFNNTDTASALNDLLLTNLTSTGDGTVTIASTGAAGSAASVGINGIGTLAETDGVLATVTVTGNNYFYLGYDGGVSTDHATTSTADITSALHTIDASATTGGISINAGNTSLDASFSEVSYKGLVLDGGSGAGDILYDGANSGVVTDGNGKADAVWLGGSSASGALGTGASDMAEVGNSAYATAVTPVGPEVPGSALGDSVTFGAGATAEIIISGGAEWDGSTYVGNNANNGVGQTTVVGAVAAGGTSPGTLIDLGHIVGASTNIVNAQGVTAGASNLTAAENTAAAAVGGVGVAYFTYGPNEFLVAAHALEGGVSVGDAVVSLHGVGITGLSMAAGVVHLV